MLKAAAANEQQGHRVLQALLDRRKREIPSSFTPDLRSLVVDVIVDITEGVLKVAVRNEGRHARDIFMLLLERGARGFVTEAVMNGIAGNIYNRYTLMKTLANYDEVTTRRSPNYFCVSHSTLSVAAANKGCGHEILQYIELGLGEFTDSEIVEEVMLAAASNRRQGKDITRHFIQTKGRELPITKEVYEAAHRNNGCGKDILLLLERWELGDYSGEI